MLVPLKDAFPFYVTQVTVSEWMEPRREVPDGESCSLPTEEEVEMRREAYRNMRREVLCPTRYVPSPIPSRKIRGQWVPLPVPTVCDK